MRAPSGLATLYLGLQTFLEFAVDHGVLDAQRALRVLDDAEVALVAIGRRQAAVGSQDAVRNESGAHAERIQRILSLHAGHGDYGDNVHPAG